MLTLNSVLTPSLRVHILILQSVLTSQAYQETLSKEEDLLYMNRQTCACPRELVAVVLEKPVPCSSRLDDLFCPRAPSLRPFPSVPRTRLLVWSPAGAQRCLLSSKAALSHSCAQGNNGDLCVPSQVCCNRGLATFTVPFRWLQILALLVLGCKAAVPDSTELYFQNCVISACPEPDFVHVVWLQVAPAQILAGEERSGVERQTTSIHSFQK